MEEKRRETQRDSSLRAGNERGPRFVYSKSESGGLMSTRAFLRSIPHPEKERVATFRITNFVTRKRFFIHGCRSFSFSRAILRVTTEASYFRDTRRVFVDRSRTSSEFFRKFFETLPPRSLPRDPALRDSNAPFPLPRGKLSRPFSIRTTMAGIDDEKPSSGERTTKGD